MDAEELYAAVGLRVRKYRRAEKLNQAELGEICRINRSTIAVIESGKQAVALHQVFRIAAALKVRPLDLIPDNIEFEVHDLLHKIDGRVSNDDRDTFAKMMGEVFTDKQQHQTASIAAQG
jgi:transcriptional regulator with XRE-family HTH domain